MTTQTAPDAAQTEQRNTPPASVEAAPAVASNSQRQIFENITHTLSDSELTNPAVVKLIIDRMHSAESQQRNLEQYVDLYHAADKEVGVLQEKLSSSKTIEVLLAVALTLGGAAVGFIPYFLNKGQIFAAVICATTPSAGYGPAGLAP